MGPGTPGAPALPKKGVGSGVKGMKNLSRRCLCPANTVSTKTVYSEDAGLGEAAGRCKAAAEGGQSVPDCTNGWMHGRTD